MHEGRHILPMSMGLPSSSSNWTQVTKKRVTKGKSCKLHNQSPSPTTSIHPLIPPPLLISLTGQVHFNLTSTTKGG